MDAYFQDPQHKTFLNMLKDIAVFDFHRSQDLKSAIRHNQTTSGVYTEVSNPGSSAQDRAKRTAGFLAHRTFL